jgi:hypothetical protein
MKSRPLINNVIINNIIYDPNSQNITYYFDISSIEKIIKTKIDNKGGIKFISSTKEFDELIMPLLPIDPMLVKKLVRITWEYIEGKDVILPIKII